MIKTRLRSSQWADRVLRMFLSASQAETVAGDLLEEYRARRHSDRGRALALPWYVWQVLSVGWHTMWPWLAAALVVRLLSIPVAGTFVDAIDSLPLIRSGGESALLRNPSIIPAPFVGQIDALLAAAVGFFGARKTNRVGGGVVMSMLIGAFSVPIVIGYSTVIQPARVLDAFTELDFVLFVSILAVISSIVAAFWGWMGALVGRYLPRGTWTASR